MFRVRRAFAQTPGTSVNTLIAATIIVGILYIGRSVLIPIAVAVLLAFILSPLVRMLRRLKLPSVVAVILVVGLCFIVLVAAGFLVAKQVTVLAENIPRYEYSLREKVKTLRGATLQSAAVNKAAKTISDLGKELSQTPQGPRTEAAQRAAPSPSDDVPGKPIPVTIQKPPESPLESYAALISTLLEPLAMTGLIFVFLTFILLQRQDLRDRFIRLAGEHDLERTTAALADAGGRLSRYFVLQSIMNALYGVAMGAALWAIGVPNPILWAGLAFMMRYVPYIGSVLAAAFPLILAAAVDPTWATFGWTLAAYVIGETVMGQVIEPMAFGTNTGLSPIAVIVSATFWTTLWGPLGLVFAVPLTLVLVTMSRHIEHLAFLDVMFGDEPALSQVDRFYQRTLAGDPVEATELAEEYIKENSLISFYDEVALGGLRSAQIDSDRGVLDDRKMSVIVDAMANVTDDLSFVENATAISENPQRGEDNEDETKVDPQPTLLPVLTRSTLPPDWQTRAPVLCVSGRSPLDAVASSLMDHLLEIHGIQCAQLSFADFSASKVKALDMTDVHVIILSYVSLGNRTAHIRSLIRRVRRTNPDAVVIAGVWDNIEHDGKKVAELNIDADHTINSLRAGLELCIKYALNQQVEKANVAAAGTTATLSAIRSPNADDTREAKLRPPASKR